jgi:hypothetical protein
MRVVMAVHGSPYKRSFLAEEFSLPPGIVRKIKNMDLETALKEFA